MKRLIKLFPVIAVLLAVIAFSLNAQTIKTPSEKGDFEEYTTYEEMMEYLQEVQATTTEMLLSDYGETIEGRKIPYAIFSRPMVTQPWEAMASGKPVVFMSANIHGGERTVREGLLLLIAELADKTSPANRLLDDLVILFIPSINPDGLVRASRGNSNGIDMNRDFMKLEQDALYNYIHNLVLLWRPHGWLDGHNGGSRPYNMCYQGPGNIESDLDLMNLVDHEMFPFIDQEMLKAGYKSWYYSGGDSTSWRVGLTYPRVANNYAGMIDCLGVLYESPGQDRKTGALSALVASKAYLQFFANNSQKVMETVNRARNETITLGQTASGDIPVVMEKVAEDYKVSYEIMIREGGTPDPNNPRRITGGTQRAVQITNADIIKKLVATKTRPRPYVYILEPRAKKAIEMLERHRVTIEVLQEDTELDVEAYIAKEITRSSQYDHPASAGSVVVEDEMHKMTRTFPKGSYIVRTGQASGRIVCHMLEPETTDNVITWNAMDAILPRISSGQGNQRGGRQAGPAIIPIFKVMVPKPLPTKILK
ncbi:DUF2817 domain-containing protein [candidate division KSB1 bacterium]